MNEYTTADGVIPADTRRPHDFFPFPTIRDAQRSAMDSWMKAMDRGKRFAVFELPTGSGKCFAPGTPILMFDGSVRPVESIRVGELVMGPDSRPRTVLELSSGVDEMFRVTPTKGDSFDVNPHHILSLQMTPGSGYLTGRSSGQHGPNRPANPAVNSVVNIPVGAYMRKPAYWRHCAKAYRVGVTFPEQSVPVDPYFLGLWLGDGDSDTVSITTMDPEVVACIQGQAAQLGLGVTVYSNGSRASAHHITTQRCGGRPDRNPLLNAFKELGVLCNKHVPLCYKRNSRENRLALLAGYLDTDGHLSKGVFEFTSVLPNLAADIAYLARSLGLACYVKPCRKASQHGTVGTYYRGLISGDVSIIPVRITRKTGTPPRRQIKSVLRTGIHVTPVGKGAYHGFSVDGDHLFLLGDFTVVHNSGLAWAIGSWAGVQDTPDYQPGAYILTTQKTLQAQYMRDFASLGMAELKGAANYPCGVHKTDCSTGKLLDNVNKSQYAAKAESGASPAELDEFRRTHAVGCGSCPYSIAKAVFASTPLGVTNFSYLLAEAAHVHQLKPRELLIIDEAHNTESALLSFVEIEVTPQRAEFVGSPLPPVVDPGDIQTARDWCLRVLLPACDNKVTALEFERDDATDSKLRERLTVKANAVKQFAGRLKFLEDEETLREWFAYSDAKTGVLKLRPLTARTIAERYLFCMGNRLLFLSATILDGSAFTRGLGLDGSTGGIKRVPSDFPLENRLIHAYPIGSMSFKNIKDNTPRACKFLARVLDRHKDEKGIIHANSYRLQQSIAMFLAETPHAPRIITHDNQPGSREAAITQHVTSPLPTVLISPSMTEGLDLAEDLSRFQVCAKVPYPSLGDPFVRARMDYDSSWFTWQTALTLVQATGRSIRSREDRAVTYITDSDFKSFMARAESILPEWWKDAIVWH